MAKKDAYKCPRCGYSTMQKGHMHKHLYRLKKTCPASSNDIVLSDTIKHHVLANRIYIVSDTKQASITHNSINTVVNNYNIMNSILSNMDPVYKIEKYAKYKNIDIRDIDDRIEEQFSAQTKRLECNKPRHFSLTVNDMLEVIDSITTMCQIDNFNIIYDEKLNKLKFFSCGEWKSQLIDGGIKELIEKVQACYLDSYECYLIRRVTTDHCTQMFDKQQAIECLERYYKFIACFDISPYIVNKCNNHILFSTDDSEYHRDTNDYSICERFLPQYKKIKDAITMQECNTIGRKVKDIVKRNTRNNVIELNKKMMDLFSMDESFQKTVLEEITCSLDARTGSGL